jgi:hypothetical protein
MAKVKRIRKALPGERFLGGSGVVILRGINPKPPKTKPKDVEKDSKEDDK